MTDIEKCLKEASELIHAFSKEQEPERLREAANKLEDVNLRRIYVAGDRRKLRSKALELWLLIVQTIDKNLDPSFDPGETIPLKISPPPLKDGTQLLPGTDPAFITDPQARKDYENAVRDNRSRQERYLMQSQLLELSETLTSKVEAFILRDFDHSSGDRAEVHNAIERMIENAERKKKLMDALEKE